ncbi:hypothetical protein [Rivibacter subsaxonicus]|uniref:Uncharacterized protein n=1 Tax=Rivibacter subsaxonicus TaxID=457575 RepID=A0A4Q7W0X6_9BURK|nr:hypothetical protein [Rivibacter subsaxonicus]RZU02884.1 hypothetical protein EV670_0914 [Rivibacter subsaxonicus]
MSDPAIVVVLALTALMVLAIESALLWGRRRRGLAVGQWLPFVLAGAGLLLALLAAALGMRWPWVGACLAIAGVAHAADLIARWPRG